VAKTKDCKRLGGYRLKLFLCLLCPMFMFYPIQVQNKDNNQTIVFIELNDPNAVESIKKQLITNTITELKLNLTMNDLNLEDCSLLIEGLDITKPGLSDAAIHLTIKQRNSPFFVFVKEDKIKILIQDTTPPQLQLISSPILLEPDQPFDPNQWIESVSDNSHEDITVTIDFNQVNLSIPKEYPVVFTAMDTSGNKTVQQLFVTVKEKQDEIIQMLNLINETRINDDLKPFILGGTHAQKAIKIRACEANQYLSHTRPDGRHYKTVFDDEGVSYQSPYEILTCAGNSVIDKFNWWMNSPKHKNDLLRKDSTHIAIGYCESMWAAIIYE